ncbi:MAG TPA: DUF3137 domain-containing protein [Candidatus Eisenbacteria bacterium]|nr:DUF3137 domain-containing protein [Candidatus Eisenbacteria bacterium]
MDAVLASAVALSVSVVLLGVAIFVASRRLAPLARARQQAIAALCAQRGLLAGAVPGDFAMVGPIASRSLTNSFSSLDHAVAIADFIRPAGKNTQFFTLLASTVAGVNVPYVAVTRRALGGIILGGPPSLELESIDFDQRFSVKAKDRRSAVMLLDPAVMQLLLDCEQVNFNMIGDKVLAYVNRAAEPRHQPTEPVEFEVLFKFLDGFMSRIPELLRSEYAATQSESAPAGVEVDHVTPRPAVGPSLL